MTYLKSPATSIFQSPSTSTLPLNVDKSSADCHPASPSTMRSIILSLLALAATSTALGINCRGDKMCGKSHNGGLSKDNDLMDEFYQALANGASAVVQGGPISPTAVYYYGQDVACHPASGVCMTIAGPVRRGEVSVTGSTLIARAGDLNSHGCWYCGSVPLSGNNNPNDAGVLEVNYVGGTVCNGVCPH